MRFLLLIPVCMSIACESSWDVVEKDGSDVFSGSCWPGEGDPIPPAGALDYGLTAADIGVDKEDAPYDGIDANCDGKDDFDQDGDGFVPPQFEGVVTLGITTSGALPATDCWDSPDVIAVQDGVQDHTISGADVFPGAAEAYYDGVDQDCGGDNDFDQDGDGFVPEIFVGVETQIEGEISVDETLLSAVDDELPGGDCWDSLQEIEGPVGAEASALVGADIFPDAADTWYDGIDQDCAGNDDFDQDGDGFVSERYTEVGTVVAGSSLEELEQAVVIGGTGEPQLSYDCNDIEPDISPSGVEIAADGVDQDCDLLDDCFEDLDLDGYGTDVILLGTVATSSDPQVPTLDSCDNGFLSGMMTGLSPFSTDCDDTLDTTHPGAAQLEDPDALFCMSDVDGDGYGDDDPIAGVDAGTDCDDLDILFNPIASDPAADGLDQNCDTVDSCYYDADSDGIGQNLSYFDATAMQATTTDCSGPNESPFNEDCNDNPNNDGGEVYPQVTLSEEQVANGVLLDSSCDPSVAYALQPPNCIQISAAVELCDGRDNDCSLDIFNPLVNNGIPDDEVDDDSDGHVECAIDSNGWDGSITTSFTQMLGLDCDDGDETIHPLAIELCDGQDNNCDTTVPSDEIDDDIDGFVECVIDGGGWDGSFTQMQGLDCDDGDATETPDVIWYADADGDTFGDLASSNACERVSLSDVLNTRDCDDEDATVYPGAPKLCDGQVNNVDADAGTCATSLSASDADEVDDDSDGFVECAIDGDGWNGTITQNFTQMQGLDCDDGDATEYPGVIWYADSDNDSFGNGSSSNECERANINDVLNTRDCKDEDETVYPGAPKLCDGQVNNVDADAGTCLTALSASDADEVDNDSDGFVECVIDGGGWDGKVTNTFSQMLGEDCDDADDTEYPGVIWYADSDGDEFGDPASFHDCDRVNTTDVLDNQDCDDGDATEYPGVIWYADSDNDSFGNGSSSNECERANSNDVLNTRDCKDGDETVYPGAPKLCDGQVNNVDADAGTCATSLSASDADEVDDDGDGFVECAIDGSGWNGPDSTIQGDDCSDAVTTTYGKPQPDGYYIHPGAAELDSTSDCMKDVDEDGYGDDTLQLLGLQTGTDCNDTDASEYPGVIWYADVDEDGFGNLASPNSCERANGDDVLNTRDCDDTDETVYPNAPKLCDGQVNDVDADAGTCGTLLSTNDSDEVDDDGDGYVECILDGGGWDGIPNKFGRDCDDGDPTEYPGVIWYADADVDGYGNLASSRSCQRANSDDVLNKKDCNDNDETVYPGAPKLCDGQVNDVDATAGTCSTELSVSNADEVDDDGDGFVECTIDGGGWDGSDSTIQGGDCSDAVTTAYGNSNPDGFYVHPGAAPSDSASLCLKDADEDDYGDNDVGVLAFGIHLGTDCDDADGTEYPGVIWYADVDGDGFGITSSSSSCARSSSSDVQNDRDCNDDDETVYPSAPKLCDGQVNDVDVDAGTCNVALSVGDSDEVDDDSDGFVECTIDDGGWNGTDMLMQGDDCNDADETVRPGATELCDGQDNDCADGVPADETDDDGDGYVECAVDADGWDAAAVTGYDDCNDEDSSVFEDQTYSVDGDGDGFGHPVNTVSECLSTPSFGNVTNNTDCDDSSIFTFPGAAETESGSDCMKDSDGDGYGDVSVGSGIVAGTDCDDDDSDSNPGAAEVVADGIDQDCDGKESCYVDGDGDGIGGTSTALSSTLDCSASGFDGTSSDCDDTDVTIYPSAVEICDGVVNDCGGTLPANEIDDDGDGYVDCTIDTNGWDGLAISGGDDCDDGDESYFECDEIAIFPAGLDHPSAEADCQNRGGHLTWIHSSEENQLVHDLCDTTTAHACQIGIVHPYSEWNNGDPLGYTNWVQSGFTGSDDYGFMRSTVGCASAPWCVGGDWDDAGSSSGDPYICRFASGSNVSGATSTSLIPIIDADQDGYRSREDCNDADSTVHPYADESAGDGVDSNCDQLEDAGIDCNGTWHLDSTATESVYLLACNTAPSGFTAADSICTGTGKYDGIASLLNDNDFAEHEDLVDLFKDPSGAFGLGTAITTNTDYNHWISYTGFDSSGNGGSWADGTSDVPNWEAGKPASNGNACAAGFFNSSDVETQVYNQSCSNTFELLTCSHRP